MNKDIWTCWKRDSHFRLTEPSITISKDGITFNASLNKIVDVTRFLNVMIELNHPENEQASKVRFILNNYEESEKNFKITRARTNEDNRRGFVACRNLIQFQPKLKRLSENKRSDNFVACCILGCVVTAGLIRRRVFGLQITSPKQHP